MGEAPDHIVLIETEEDVDRLEVDDPDRVAYISQTTLSVDETRRDHPAGCARSFPQHHRAAHRRHLLRHHQPPDGRRQMARECDLVLVIGSQQLVELEPARRGRARPRRRLAPDRQRGAGARGVARGQARRGHHAPARALPRSSSSASSSSSATRGTERRVGVRGRPGGRALHAPEGDQEGAGGAGVNCKPCSRRPGASAITVPSVS